MTIKKIIVCALVCLMTTACASRTAFSSKVRSDYRLDEAQIRSLQVYVSKTITLERILNASGGDVSADGVLETFADRREHIVITPKTPGIVTQVYDDYVLVSFETGGELKFGINQQAGNSDPWQGRYALYADYWQGRDGLLTYKGMAYRAIKDSSNAVLEVEQKALEGIDIKEVKLQGLQVRSNAN